MLFAHVGLAYQTGRYVDGLGLADELLTLARDLESPLAAEALLRPLTAVHLCWGDLAAARATAEEGLRLARQAGVPAQEILQSSLLAVIDMLAGDWQTALRRTFDDLELAERVGVTRGTILLFLRKQWYWFVLVASSRPLIGLGGTTAVRELVCGRPARFRPCRSRRRHGGARPARVVPRARDRDGQSRHRPSLPPLALAFLGEAQAAVGDDRRTRHRQKARRARP